jgi:drug/metabolite transporter (DMT)-like permease
MRTKWWAIALMVLCTAFTSTAALLNKKGAVNLELSLRGTIFNFYLIGGLCLLALATIILIIALRGGSVSVLFPIIATSYIWVTLISYYFLNEHISMLKGAGIASIFFGVILINVVGKGDA